MGERRLTPEQKLKDAFIQALGLPGDIDFSAVQLVPAIENSFDIMLNSDQVISMSSFEKAKEIVRAHGVVFTA